MPQDVTLIHPDGKRGVVTSDPAEINTLKLRGYTVKHEQQPPQPAPRRAPRPAPPPEITTGDE